MAEGNDPNTNPTPDVKSLREAAEQGARDREELAVARKQLLFARAGIDLDSKLGGLLFKTWDADPTAEGALQALQTEAAELGITSGSTKVVDIETQQSQQEFRQAFGTGTPPPVAPPSQGPDPTEAALSEFHEARKNGARREDAAVAAFDKVLRAGASGDTRVIYDPSRMG